MTSPRPVSDGLDHAHPAVLPALLSADFARILRQTAGGRPVPRLRRLMHLLLPAMQCALLHRVAHLLHRRGWGRSAAGIAALSVRVTGATIHPGSRLGPGLFVPHPVGVAFCGTAGRDLVLLPHAIVLPERPPPPSRPLPDAVPRLGDGVVIGANAAVWGAISLGDGAVVGVGVATLRDVPAGTMTISVPPASRASGPRAPSDGTPVPGGHAP